VPIYYDKMKNYWKWNTISKVYERVDETDLLCEISEGLAVSGIYKSKTKNEILESIRITGRLREVEDTPKNWIQFQDTVVDIETGRIFQATPNYMFTSCVPRFYGDAEDTPTIDKLFNDWVGPEYMQMLYEICAYCMYDAYPIHRIFCFIGSGRNGKSQFLKVLKKLVGETNTLSTELERITNSRFETSKFYKKKVAFIGETNFNSLHNTGILKQLSDGSYIPCEFKGKDSIDFESSAKIVIATNGLPITSDHTDGFYRRWLIIDFPNKFNEGKDVVADIPDAEYDNLCRKCIRILRDLLARGSFTKEGDIDERARRYEAKSNPVRAFVEECCKEDGSSAVPSWFLYDKYIEYAEQNGHRRYTKREFSSTVKGLGYDIRDKAYNEEDVNKYNESASKGRKNWKTIFGLKYKFIWGGTTGNDENGFDKTTLDTEDRPKCYTPGKINTHGRESVALVALVADVPTPNPPSRKPNKISATSATNGLPLTVGNVAGVAHPSDMETSASSGKTEISPEHKVNAIVQFCIEWERKNRTCINSSNMTNVVMDFKQPGYDFAFVKAAVQKYAKLAPSCREIANDMVEENESE
jgi:putative DNA primase/helicase